VPHYYVENFGCRATQADGAALERQFEERGLRRASSSAEAQIVVLNTCTVTAAADQDARAAIRRVRRQNPQAEIVVTGCYAQRAPEEIAALPGVKLVIGNSHKHQLAQIALNRTTASPTAGTFAPLGVLTSFSDSPLTERPKADDQRPIFVSDIFAHTELLAAPVFDAANERTRPNLKVQDGCDNRCSFCVIPYVRGQSRSLKMAEIIREVNVLVEAGYREVVISGINLGRWGRDLSVSQQTTDHGPRTMDPRPKISAFGPQTTDLNPQLKGLSPQLIDITGPSPFGFKVDGPKVDGPKVEGPGSNAHGPRSEVGGLRPDASFQPRTFENLIRAILSGTSLEKLRISSVEPMDWSGDLIDLVATSPRIAKHAHVPLQSGSDAVLRRMHRKYRPWHYREKIEKIRAAMPTAAIGADVMVGFPGETEAEFEATRRLIEDLPFTYLHVFTYSARPGTPAASMQDQVPVQIARERNRVLRELAEKKKQAFMRGFIGERLEAITLNVTGTDESGDFTEALTDNYLKLRLKGIHRPNRWQRIRITGITDGALIAT
jgi:tRNA A37 methylthiotransferase MiaB